MTFYQQVGRNIYNLRTEKGFKQEAFALITDISVSNLRRIEHGKANPTIHTLMCIAETLKVPVEALVKEIPDSEK